MSRRRHEEETSFGSDSFLDVIANIVGILIILIVIAGVRVGQQPVEVAEPSPEPPTRAASLPEPAPVLTEAVPISPAMTAAILKASEPAPLAPPLPKSTPKSKPRPVMVLKIPAPPKPLLPSPELLRAIADLKAELNTLERQSHQADDAEQQLKKWQTDLSGQIDNARQTLQSGADDAADQHRLLKELERSLERTQLVFIGKQQELSKAQQQDAPTEKLEHRLTPVSRVVDGNELHFHVKEQRVAYVPLMELVERMKPQILRQREWLLKYNEHRGSVGPHRGFRLEYVVVREQMSALEQARNGGGVGRVMPVLLKFLPEEELIRETLAEALRPGSVFIRELQMAEANTTLTFWVYPDSYGTYQQLKAFAHAEGFSVAARPLKADEVISASPWGTKSAGQ